MRLRCEKPELTEGELGPDLPLQRLGDLEGDLGVGDAAGVDAIRDGLHAAADDELRLLEQVDDVELLLHGGGVDGGGREKQRARHPRTNSSGTTCRVGMGLSLGFGGLVLGGNDSVGGDEAEIGRRAEQARGTGENSEVLGGQVLRQRGLVPPLADEEDLAPSLDVAVDGALNAAGFAGDFHF